MANPSQSKSYFIEVTVFNIGKRQLGIESISKHYFRAEKRPAWGIQGYYDLVEKAIGTTKENFSMNISEWPAPTLEWLKVADLPTRKK